MSSFDLVKSKIYSWDKIEEQIFLWKSEDKKIVFTNGCFDILHLGHIQYLSEAKDLGDILIVGLNSDTSDFWKTKGPNRPINNQNARSVVLSSLFFIDAIVLFSEKTPLELISHISPDILVKGKDYKETDIVGYDIVKYYGGKVMTIELVNGYSTTSIIEKITDKF